jgi:hypothetical protein
MFQVIFFQSAANVNANVHYTLLDESVVHAIRKKLKLSYDSGDCGGQKCKRSYGGTCGGGKEGGRGGRHVGYFICNLTA